MALPKGQYKPTETEKEVLDYWMENKFYSPEYTSEDELSTASNTLRQAQGDKVETYTNILPPPNANGNLHLGHMSGYAYQDLMGRYQRMQGKKVLLLPGKDHAGIQTEVVFEKELEKKGKSKKDLGREIFYKACYKFCMKQSEIARQQEKNLGLSADFDRELFTLDPKVVDEVLQTFIDMHKDGLIYRSKRLINWCVRCQSALADIDTEYKDSVGKFYYFKYGFTTPDEYAVYVKNTYGGKEVEAVVERFKGMEYSNKKGEKFEWKFNYYGSLEGEICPGDDMDLDVMFVGYEDGIMPEEKLSGKAIGIMMRLDRDFKLILANPAADEEEIESEIEFLFDDSSKYFGGAHIIKFEDYPDDKFYTNGFVMGTVRPETKFGDTAIAVNPKDERYKEYVGNEYEVLTLNGPAKIKIVGDNHVDMGFGTGALKVTPAHSSDDWDIATRHPEIMPEKQVIGFDGKLNHLTGKYEGMTVNQAREAMIPDMKEIGMLIKLDEHYENRRQICERCKHPIEPLISHQWFLDTKPLKEKARKLVNDGHTNIMPDGKENVYMNWMNQPEDWCITRQLWWGYRVPVWYKHEPTEYVTETGEVREKIGDKVVDKREDYEGIIHVGQNPPGINLTVIRHGEATHNKENTIAGHIDTELTEDGINEAKAAADKAKEKKYDVVLCSDLKRTKQTADVITKELGIEVTEYLEILRERNYGVAQGMTKKEVIEKYGDEFWNAEIEDAETLEQLTERTNEVIEYIKANYPDAENVLIVTHGGILGEISRILSNKEIGDMPSGMVIKAVIPEEGWIQDEDVLDTWFSSGQWPVATLMAREGDFDEFYSTQVMETGWDIVIFWVTRMMLLCPYKAEKVKGQLLNVKCSDSDITPFKDVYLHGLVLDKNGVKMSKSKGNGIDPFEMMNKYGTDALRLSFVVGNKVGQNYRLYEEKIESFRNYCNKIWNVSKFALTNLNDDFDPKAYSLKDITNEDDKKMIEHMQGLIDGTTRRMDTFNFGVAATELYESMWHEFADVYLEAIKPRTYTKDREGNAINQSLEEQESRKQAIWTLWYCLDKYLRLLHPFIPFITERIWRELPKIEGESETVMYSQWPK